MTQIISRANIKEVLERWAEGTLSAEEVHAWAGQHYQNRAYDFEDREDQEENSVSNEVLAQLDMLDMNLLVPEDIPSYIEFLSTPLGGFDDGYSKLKAYLGTVNIDVRREQLKGTSPYQPFCR
ncbi:hypothetical protein ACFO5Q_12375 [Kordiimonas lipolytica]|uniref:Uncharacterized protein n=1 Tax=Kordiimonas lipolytica TaxID=1662421 RepID=A0ABV8UCU7_9PROT|nr:hypothetical protein [Kordiimonas lipolytica]